MAQENKKKRGRSSGNSVLLMLVLVLIGAIAAVVTVMIVNDGKLWGGEKKPAPAKIEGADDEGKIAVPICARGIEAYAAVQNEDLIDPKVKDFAVRKVDALKAKENGFITDITAIRGRVMGRDKLPGYAFVEADFLPKGTRPGPGAAIETGMRGVWIEPSQVQGLDSLRRGDRFDLMAMVKVRDGGASTDARYATPGAQAARADDSAWSTSKRLLVSNGKVVVAVPQDAQARRGKKIFVQVAESEVDELQSALTVNAEIVSYQRSGQPGAGETNLPEPARPQAMDTIQVMQGGKTTTVQVPSTPPK